jgi:AraC-like DNA-binding protein
MINNSKLFEATEELSDILRHFYCFEISEGIEIKHGRLAPNFDMLLMFNFNKPVRIFFGNGSFEGAQQIERVAALGPLRKMLNYEMRPEMDVIIIVFTMDGFYRLFQTEIDGIDNEKLIDPDAFFEGPLFNDLWLLLKNTRGMEERIQLLSEFLLSMTKKSDHATVPLLESVVYFDNPNLEPVKAIAQDQNLSERTIQLRFKKYTGFAPKEMLRFKRFKLVLNHLIENSKTQTKWMNLIYQYGYHDQSHLIKDFRYYLGTTPKQFVSKLKDDLFCVSKPGKHY